MNKLHYWLLLFYSIVTRNTNLQELKVESKYMESIEAILKQ